MVTQIRGYILAAHQAILFFARKANRGTSQIRVVCVSDTHSKTVPIPDGDLLIHAGDLTHGGSLAEIQATINWLASLPHAHKIAICGNGDLFFDDAVRLQQDRSVVKDGIRAVDCIEWGNVVFLQRSSFDLNVRGRRGLRSLRVYGDPYVPHCGEIDAFQYDHDVDFWKDTIPAGTDIVVSHTPSKFCLDDWDGETCGCPSLAGELARIKPSLHVCGHVHPASGHTRVWWSDPLRKAYMSFAERDDAAAKGKSSIAQAVELFIPAARLLLYSIREVLSSWMRSGTPYTEVVNAACASDDGKFMKHLPRVLDI